MFSTELGPAPALLAMAEHVLKKANWEIAAGRDYQTYDITEGSGYYRAFFLKLPPHSKLHRHVDAGDIKTDHVVIQTNEHCLNWWMDGETERSEHLKHGHRYNVDRTVLHWATNDGDTDRIHLLLEYR
jgi:hypothetical protein